MLKRLCLAVVLCAASASAQMAGTATVSLGASRSGGPPAAPDKVTPQQQKYGAQLLEIAEADAAGLEGGMRAFACWQLARGYERTDKKKALELLETGLTALCGWDEPSSQGPTPPRMNSGKSFLQEQILRTMVPLAPERVDELLSQVEPSAREHVLTSLMGYYEKNQQFDRVIETIFRISQESEMPYGAAMRAMKTLKPEQSGELLQLFSASLASYTSHKHDGMFMGDDFGTMISAFWSRLPKNLVHDAIDEVLHQAEEAEKDSKRGNTVMSSSSDKGTVSFNSTYDYRLFQLLPVLRRIDESAAKSLLEKRQQLAATLDKYPDGFNSLQSDTDDAKKPEQPRSNMNFAVSGSPNNIAAKMQEMGRAQKLLADADAHPEQVLANISTIQDPSIKAQTLSNLARMAAKKHPSEAHTALDRLSDLLDKLDSRERLNMISASADTYMQMDDTDSAKKMVEKGLKAAAAAYEEDANADNPNKALKAYWPSAAAYTSLLRLAGKISPQWALTLLKEISDPEIKANAEIALATSWLGVPAGAQMTQTQRKGSTGTSISMARDE